MTPTKGFRFLHSRVIDERDEPVAYVVTKIARDTVYYRPERGGAPQCCPIEQFTRWCLRAA